jgi:putative flippase GtrA
MQRSLKPPLMVSLRRSQIASLTATVVNFSCLVFLVEVARVWYVVATAIASFQGAFVNFMLGRHWSFTADDEGFGGQ